MRRRQVLLGTGVAIPAVLAGCTGDEGGDDTDDDTGEPGSDDEEDTETDQDDEDEAEEEEADDGADDTDDGDEADTDETEAIDPDSEPPVAGLRIEEHELVEDDYSVSVTGLVVNESGEELTSVEVGVVFYDADGDRVDSDTTRIGTMDDEAEYGFEIMSLEDDIVGYDLAIIDGAPAERTP